MVVVDLKYYGLFDLIRSKYLDIKFGYLYKKMINFMAKIIFQFEKLKDYYYKCERYNAKVKKNDQLRKF